LLLYQIKSSNRPRHSCQDDQPIDECHHRPPWTSHDGQEVSSVDVTVIDIDIDIVIVIVGSSCAVIGIGRPKS